MHTYTRRKYPRRENWATAPAESVLNGALQEIHETDDDLIVWKNYLGTGSSEKR